MTGNPLMKSAMSGARRVSSRLQGSYRVTVKRLREALRGPIVAGRGRAKEVEVVCAVPDAVPQRLDGAPLRDPALKPRRKLAPGRPILVKRQGFGGLRLRGAQEGGELDEIGAVLAVAIPVAASAPANSGMARGRCGCTD